MIENLSSRPHANWRGVILSKQLKLLIRLDSFYLSWFRYRFGLITDHFLKVKNTKNIFSLGDCSTVQFKKFPEYINMLLDEAGIQTGVEITQGQFESKLVWYILLMPPLKFRWIFEKQERNSAQSKKVFKKAIKKQQ